MTTYYINLAIRHTEFSALCNRTAKAGGMRAYRQAAKKLAVKMCRAMGGKVVTVIRRDLSGNDWWEFEFTSPACVTRRDLNGIETLFGVALRINSQVIA